jgi:formylglycine-generating enzyme required for sulfatase activity
VTLNATGIPAIPWRTNAPRILLVLALIWFCASYPNNLDAATRPPGSVEITGGSIMPMYGAGKTPAKLPVKPFQIDAFPITNEQFLKFVSSVPGWDKKNASSLLVDEKYLGHWQDTERGFRPDKSNLKSPVTNVSWFGANEYCKWRNGRLPSVLEWEYVAAASETEKDASSNPKFVAKLLQWYAPQCAGQPGPLANIAEYLGCL